MYITEVEAQTGGGLAQVPAARSDETIALSLLPGNLCITSHS